MRPFRPRAIRSHGLREHRGWRLKPYSISYDGSALDWAGFEAGIALALESLPTPAVAAGRPGLAVLVAHAGRDCWYIVLSWWDRENELPTRVFVAERTRGGEPAWRPARGGESFCVWDLEVLWFERQAYVATLLADGAGPGAEADYLARAAGARAER